MWYITRRTIRQTIIAWGPVLLALVAMTLASAQPKYGPPGGQPTTVYFSGAIPVFPGLLEGLVKKSAHVIAFGGLALLVLRALTLNKMPALKAGYLTVVIVFAYACFDELHQAGVPGRHASGIDVGLDFIGAALCVLIARRFAQPPQPACEGCAGRSLLRP